jgi:hypothetical protein
VTLAAQCAANPSGSTPQQTESWADCKAAYRLLDCKEVTFAALATPHWQLTRARTSGHYLLLGDTTAISFDAQRQIEGMGIINKGAGKGYLLHSSLMIEADHGTIVGLAGQTIYYRQRVPKQEKARDRLKRPCESDIWGEVIDQVGPPPENVRFTHVFDRGADNFDVYCHLYLQGTDWVVRAAQLTRLIITESGETMQLGAHMSQQPVWGTYELAVAANKNQRARTAKMEVRACVVTVPRPKDCGRFAKACGLTSIRMYAVEVREIDPPKKCKPLRWVLLTSHRVQSFQDAWNVIGYYEQRPIVEELHKGIKTGCRLEERLYEEAHRWEALTAFVSIVAVRLLQMKTIAKEEPNRPAVDLVPLKWIKMLSAVRKGKQRNIVTARDFLRALAGLGGHLGRKRDGEPGWITLWRGFNSLHLLLRGAEAVDKKCG